MNSSKATLHMMCGKIAAGKSTLSAKIAETDKAVLVGEDSWVARLYPGEIQTIEDYTQRADRLRETMRPHLVDLLHLGQSVVLDFHANTIASRRWMRSVFEQAGAAHKLHFLDAPDDVCLARLRARNAAGAHEFAANDAVFAIITSHFVPPQASEGFDVVRYG